MFDRECMFSFQQALAASAVSGDVVFTGFGDAGKGTPKMVEITGTAATGGGSLVANVETADDPAGPWTQNGSTAIAADTLAKGGTLATFALPTGLKDYVRLNYTVTGTLTGLIVTAGIIGLAGQTNR